MKVTTMLDQVERLEDQLQAIKWAVGPSLSRGRVPVSTGRSVVSQTAGLLRGRLPSGVTYQRRLRREWELRLKRQVS